ncbi:MAG: VCBS repeat-containing protein, partial [Cyclobacteriaceae bacterium]|nr:VCBS repeat-containing protein [Cyclobacteriaceae bacterium]
VPQNVFWDDNEIPLPDAGFDYLHNFKNTQWKMIDFDGDGIEDLVCAAQSFQHRKYRGRVAKLIEKEDRFSANKNQLIFLKNKGGNNEPIYKNPTHILKVDGTPLAEGIAIKPMFADFDNDGDFDFIGIGKPENADDYDVAWKNNFILYFENTGTKSNYEFSGSKVLTHNGIPVRMESRSTIHTTAIDWNKDEHVDIIAGEESGRISFLKNTGQLVNGVPQFLPPRFFQQEAKYVDFGALVAPRVFDWDGDGLDDIISGNEMGHIGFIKNLGGKTPMWDGPKLLEIDGIPIRLIKNEALPNTEEPIWGYTTIDVGYWDEDDLPDVLVNEHNGNIV